MSRDSILSDIRSALGRTEGQAIPEPPAVLLSRTAKPQTMQFAEALTALAGTVHIVKNAADVAETIETILDGRTTVMSDAPILVACGLPYPIDVSREALAKADVGITSADYALADTGSIVMLSHSGESRLISLLPPCHIAVIPVSRLLSGLDELLERLPDPLRESSAMAIITGPSRTADIELRLVRGVHGPGEIHVVLINTESR